MLDHGIHHHLKDGGGEWVPLGDPSVAFEQVPVVVPYPGHHEDVLPVVAENPPCPQSDPVSKEDLHAALSVEVVVRFPDVKEDLLPRRHHLLEQLGFEGGGPCPLACMKSM